MMDETTSARRPQQEDLGSDSSKKALANHMNGTVVSELFLLYHWLRVGSKIARPQNRPT